MGGSIRPRRRPVLLPLGSPSPRREARPLPAPPGVIVDVGAGTGELLVRVSKLLGRQEVIAVDASPAMARIAAGKLPGARAVVASAEALPFRPGRAAAVLTTISFHHWPSQDGGLAEAARVLHPEGMLLLADFFAAGPLGGVVGRARAGHGSGMRSERELPLLFEQAPLRIATIERIGPPVSPLRLVAASSGS